MGAHHFFVAPQDIAGDVITIRDDEARHAVRVLRVRRGERISAADDAGRIVHAVVTDIGDDVRADVVRETFVDVPFPAITLYQALGKGDTVDEVIQKATEVGVARIVPFVAERSIVRWDDAKRAKARDRWNAIARSASKQCRSPRLTTVGAIAEDVRPALDGPGPTWVLHEADDVTPFRNVLTQPAPATAALVVGPEGGLSDVEVRMLRDGGAEVVGLGPRILRTETAGPVAAAIVGYAYGTLG